MSWIAQLLIPLHRKNQHELATRAAEVITHVLFDIGIDRFLDGTMLVDRRLRVRFAGAGVHEGMRVHAAVHAGSLAKARALRPAPGEALLAGAALQARIAPLVDELMAAFLAQSPVLRALPAGRHGPGHGELAASP